MDLLWIGWLQKRARVLCSYDFFFFSFCSRSLYLLKSLISLSYLFIVLYFCVKKFNSVFKLFIKSFRNSWISLSALQNYYLLLVFNFLLLTCLWYIKPDIPQLKNKINFLFYFGRHKGLSWLRFLLISRYSNIICIYRKPGSWHIVIYTLVTSKNTSAFENNYNVLLFLLFINNFVRIAHFRFLFHFNSIAKSLTYKECIYCYILVLKFVFRVFSNAEKKNPLKIWSVKFFYFNKVSMANLSSTI